MNIHYRGEARYQTASGGIRTMLAGWAVCCSGDRAAVIRSQGNHTYDRSKVTCRACLKVLEKHDAYAAQKAREPLPPDVLADAMQDRVHEDTGAGRPARAVRCSDNTGEKHAER